MSERSTSFEGDDGTGAFNMNRKKRGVRRIAVLGGNNAGKTVFITSLIDNLQYFDPNKLNIGDEWSILEAKITNDGKVGGLDRFPHEKYRRTLFGADWPKKTFSASIACLDIKLKRIQSKWYKKDVITRKVEIVDIAGERTADFEMIDHTFKEWSLMITNQLHDFEINWDEQFKKCAATSETDTESSVLNSYRYVLVTLYKKGANASITPSTARITPDGQGLGGRPDEYSEVLKEHPLGLEEFEFAPLPEEAFTDDKYKALVEKFEAAYNEYRKEIVVPMWDWLKGADDVIYLVDVPGILANGTFAYNAERALARDCFSAIRNTWRMEESLISKGKEWLKAKREGRCFSRLIVVGTKADLVDIESRGNIKELSKQFLERVVGNCGFDMIEYTYCAAVCANVAPEKTMPFPDKWDEEWPVGKYVFENKSLPIKRLRNDIAPKNFQLGAIARMILSLG